MATAGTVTIKLDGDSARLIRELNKANQASKSTFGEIKREAADVAAKFAVIATAAATAFAMLTKASFDSIDELAKVSDRLGVTTEAMRTLQVAADLAGVSQELLTKSLQKQQQALVSASDGAGTAGQAFARLGLNVQALIELPADQQFAAIADAIANVDNVTRRNALAMEIWGARAAEMINFAAGGSAGISELSTLLDELNVTVSRFDASQIEQANDAVSVAKLAFEGLGNSIAVAVAPLVQGLAKDFTAAAREANGFQSQVQQSVDSLVSGGAIAMNVMEGIGLAFGVVADVIQGVVYIALGAFTSAFRAIGELFRVVVVTPILAGLQKILDASAALGRFVGFDSMADGAASASAAIQGVRDSLKNASDSAATAGRNLVGFGLEQFGDASDSVLEKFETEWSGSAWERRYAGYVQASKDAAAAAGSALQGGGGLDVSGDPLKAGEGRNLYAQTLIAPKIDVPEIDIPKMPHLDPAVAREMADLSAQQYLESWQLANEQRRVAEEELRATLFQSDEQAGIALIELAAAQAREKVIAEWEARGQAISETGETADPAQQSEFELAVKEQMLASEADLLNRRLAMQQSFGGQYIGLQKSITALMGKTWADGHKKTLANTATFASATMSITQSLFGQNKKVSIAMAIISTLQGAANALSTVPYPANIAAAATVLANGFAQVNSIKSTNIGSTSTGGSVGGGGLGAAPTSQPISNATNDEQENRRSAIQVVFQGDVVGWDDFMRDRFVSSLRDLVDGNDVILFGSNSRQAAEIRGA
jgi:hypothetical protein